MNDVRMRAYSDTDLPRLCETFAAWIAEAGRCGYDHVGEVPHRIYENLRGRHPVGDLVQLWEAVDPQATGSQIVDSQIVGLAVNLRFGEAFDVFTAPALRGTAIESGMLRVAYQTTARQMAVAGSAEPYVSTDVFDCDATRIRLLTALGFERFRIWDEVTTRDLAEPVAEPAVPAGFLVRPARLADADQLAAAHNSAFGEDWTGELYRSAVMTKPGYDPEREIVAEAPDGRIAAFTVHWLDGRNRIGHFEPVGTHRDFHRRGLARAVMRDAMRRMRTAGMATVTVNYNADNVPAHRLYASLGFRREHQTYGFRRHRPDPADT